MKKLINKFKMDPMLLATLVTSTFYSTTFPYINKMIISNVSESVIAIQNIVYCIAVIVFGSVWNKAPKMFKYYPMFCIAETVGNVLLCVITLLTHNMTLYYVIDTVIICIVTRNLCCGGIRLRAMVYNDEDSRNNYDNNNNTMNSIGVIVGSSLAIGLRLSFDVMLIIATIGNCFDNIMYIYIYYHYKNKKST